MLSDDHEIPVSSFNLFIILHLFYIYYFSLNADETGEHDHQLYKYFVLFLVDFVNAIGRIIFFSHSPHLFLALNSHNSTEIF